jgi:hypothetical protein
MLSDEQRPWMSQITSDDLTVAQRERVRLPYPNVTLITGVICGVRVEEIEEPLMQKIRYLDKLVDELAKGKPMEKVRREPVASPSPSRAGGPAARS